MRDSGVFGQWYWMAGARCGGAPDLCHLDFQPCGPLCVPPLLWSEHAQSHREPLLKSHWGPKLWRGWGRADGAGTETQLGLERYPEGLSWRQWGRVRLLQPHLLPRPHGPGSLVNVRLKTINSAFVMVEFFVWRCWVIVRGLSQGGEESEEGK